MAEIETKRVGKFTVINEAESPTSQILGPEASTEEAKSRTQSPADSLDDAFTLKTSQPRRRGRPPGSKNKVQAVVGEMAQAPADYKLWAQILIGSSNTVVVTWLGMECAMEKREAEMLEPPLSRMLARMPVSTSQKMATFIDPMVMLIALGMWGNRIIRIQRAKRDHGISDAELARASGVVTAQATNGVENPPEYQQPVEADMPPRTRVPVNPNGVPTAITSQMGEV
ncbi:MAG TPA: hypothetical protein VH593_29130 [Ktedonobacteraceae bacterium]|jgi:hypothetical protein